MSDAKRLTLMEVSALWKQSLEKYGPGGFLAADVKEMFDQGLPGLDYIEQMAETYFNFLKRSSAGNELTEAITHVAYFNILMTVITMVKIAGSHEGMFSGVLGAKLAEDVEARIELFLEHMDDEHFRYIIETLTSTAVMVGIGIALDEGLASLPEKGDAKQE